MTRAVSDRNPTLRRAKTWRQSLEELHAKWDPQPTGVLGVEHQLLFVLADQLRELIRLYKRDRRRRRDVDALL